jgi:hypothetical protein
MHGADSPRGIAHAKFKHGLSVRTVLPSRYLAAYDAAMLDPDFVSLKNEIAVVKARQNELLARMSTGESGASWRDAMKAFNEDNIIGLKDILMQGIDDERQWNEARENIEALRRLSDTERRRLESAQAYMTAEEIGVVAGFFAGMIKRYVRNPEDLQSCGREMGQFFEAWRTRGPEESGAGSGPLSGAQVVRRSPESGVESGVQSDLRPSAGHEPATGHEPIEAELVAEIVAGG